jgi:hypothetical protein
MLNPSNKQMPMSNLPPGWTMVISKGLGTPEVMDSSTIPTHGHGLMPQEAGGGFYPPYYDPFMMHMMAAHMQQAGFFPPQMSVLSAAQEPLVIAAPDTLTSAGNATEQHASNENEAKST